MQDENLEPIQVNSIRAIKKPNTVINNFFTIITIAIMSIVIIWYVNFILPEQKNAQKRNQIKLEKLDQIKLLKQKRLEQIQLSRKLNANS